MRNREREKRLRDRAERNRDHLFVSRQGLASCPDCGRHVRLDRHDGACPFCAAAVPVAARTRRSAHGLVVVSLIGATSLVAIGCPAPSADVYGGPPTDRRDEADTTEAPAPDEAPGDPAADDEDDGAPPPQR